MDYPTVAFHYAGFVATDYGGLYSTKEAAAAAGFFYADTPTLTNDPVYGTLTVVSNTTTNTEYTWTPPSAMTADVLMVAGGGGGGGSWGGGGGAGGLVFNENVTLNSQKTIVIGNGGAGGLGNLSGNELGVNGSHTSVTGFIDAIGGGGGGGNNTGRDGLTGGSGGGGSRDGGDGFGGSGTLNQGNSGGDGDTTTTNYAGGGGGGARSAGVAGDGDVGGGSGGEGISYTSIFSSSYGDNGYFASGGGGGAESDRNIIGGISPLGGGGDGTNSSTVAGFGQKHTGGGGGGAGFNVNSNSRLGGNGGSGVVLVKQTSYLLEATFSDAWTSGTTYVTLGSTFTLPTITNITGVTVTGSVDSATAGTYDVVWSKVVGGVPKSVTRRFVVDYPVIAFHYGNFDDTDYGGIYSTKEAAAADGFIYADTASFTNSTFGSVAVSTPSQFVYEFYITVITSYNPTSIGFVWTEVSSTSTTITDSMITLNRAYVSSSGGSQTQTQIVTNGNTTESGGYIYGINPSVGEKMFTITSSVELTQLSISTHRPSYYPGFKIVCNGTTLLSETANGGTSDAPSPYTKSYTLSLSSFQTQYAWTPVTAMTANVLMVAGGGGGGGGYGGGGGAGGLILDEDVSLSGQKTIVVGNGGSGGEGYNNGDDMFGINGSNTSVSGLTTVIGGGGGGHGGGNVSGKDGGSGGGGSRNSNGTGGGGTLNQGNNGGSSSNSAWGGGGGGAGSLGSASTSSAGGNGGNGLNFSDTFGSTYGDYGYFASGGGGGGRVGNSGAAGVATFGGGSDGVNNGNKVDNAQKHTGGGGGGHGGDDYYTSGLILGGNGGSGIVLIKQSQ